MPSYQRGAKTELVWLRVSPSQKLRWLEAAKIDKRSLSNWISIAADLQASTQLQAALEPPTKVDLQPAPSTTRSPRRSRAPKR